jgi:hypothetical protein
LRRSTTRFAQRCAHALPRPQVLKEKINLTNAVESADYDRRTPLHLAARRAARVCTPRARALLTRRLACPQ